MAFVVNVAPSRCETEGEAVRMSRHLCRIVVADACSEVIGQLVDDKKDGMSEILP